MGIVTRQAIEQRERDREYYARYPIEPEPSEADKRYDSYLKTYDAKLDGH